MMFILIITLVACSALSTFLFCVMSFADDIEVGIPALLCLGMLIFLIVISLKTYERDKKEALSCGLNYQTYLKKDSKLLSEDELNCIAAGNIYNKVEK